MVSQIQLGNLFSVGGRNIISGGSSGLDFESLIGDLVAAKRQPAVLLEGKIETNTARSTSMGELKSLMNDFKDAANFLRKPPGVQNQADNIFEYRSSSVTSNTSVAGSAYLSVTAEPGASIGTNTIQINQLATQNVQTTNTFALPTADDVVVGGALNPGTLLVGASAYAVTLTAGDTLNQVAAKINAVKDQSGVEATIIKVSNGNYRLSFKTLETGAAQNYDINAANPGIFNTGFAIQQNAFDSQFVLDGTIIDRSTNSIDDVVDGITFNLLAVTPPATDLTLEVEADTELAKQGIINFVDAYNAFRLFVSRQSEIGPDGKPTEEAVLAGNSAMQQAMSRVSSEVQHIVNGIAGSDPSRLADIGITFSDYPGDEETPFTRNILTVDEEKLDSALQSNFDGVRKVFEFNVSSSDPSLTVFKRTNGLSLANFQLDIDQTNGVYQAHYTDSSGAHTINLDKSDISGGGVVLTGQSGTALEGLVLLYASTNDSMGIDVDITQGVGDRVYNALDNLLTSGTGSIDVASQKIADESTRYEEEITRIDDQLEKYRESLLRKFSALEAAISSANTILQSLDAQAAALAAQ